MRAVEQAIRGLEEEQWRRRDPEKSARADDMVAKLQEAIAKVEADLDKARAAGDEKKVAELEENLASRRPSSRWPSAPPPTSLRSGGGRRAAESTGRPGCRGHVPGSAGSDRRRAAFAGTGDRPARYCVTR